MFNPHKKFHKANSNGSLVTATKPNATYVFCMVSVVLLYILQSILTNVLHSMKIYYCMKFLDPTLGGVIVFRTSQVGTVDILVLMLETSNVGIWWRDVHTTFYENLSVV
jgi:hypothetical protein